MTTANVSQVGLEVWGDAPSKLMVTQTGLEVWGSSTSTTTMKATQVGLEVWAWASTLSFSSSGIWQSDPFPTPYSLYTEANQPMQFDWETVLLPDNQQLRENLIIEANLDFAFIGAQPVVTVVAEDTNDNPIQTLTVQPTGTPTIWGQFTWGQAPWAGTLQDIAPYQLAWTQPLVFKQASFSATGVCAVGLRIGTLYLNFQIQGYQQQSRSGVN
jgi:hypothetical protein